MKLRAGIVTECVSERVGEEVSERFSDSVNVCMSGWVSE